MSQDKFDGDDWYLGVIMAMLMNAIEDYTIFPHGGESRRRSAMLIWDDAEKFIFEGGLSEMLRDYCLNINANKFKQLAVNKRKEKRKAFKLKEVFQKAVEHEDTVYYDLDYKWMDREYDGEIFCAEYPNANPNKHSIFSQYMGG
jgi:hypothetical protein